MSADNWQICPKCIKNRQEEIQRAEEHKKSRLDTAYGTLSREEFSKLQTSLQNQPQAAPLKETFREDWDIGMQEDGSLLINYRGSCSSCGFAVNFKQEKNYLEETK